MQKVIIFDDMSQCTKETVQKMLTLVSEQRRQQAMQFKHIFGQFACLKSYLILKEILTNFFDFNEKDHIHFNYGEYGKPYIIDGPHFSISHCKEAIAVAVSNTPIGIDIESMRHISEGLIKKTMNNDEQKIIERSDNREEAFIKIWTKKEAVLKMYGTGINDNITNTLDRNAKIETISHNEKRYIYSVATTTKESQAITDL
ncbi:MAG: 4'-phosphopantetheinyl transferase superfamily protein [Prevotella sp.]|nr:4'-phosphopantetheinyl transferase superfamily protein [Candidatus Equicola stercoris]